MATSFLYKSGDTVKTKQGEITIIEQIYPKDSPWKNRKGYSYACNRCPHSGDIREEKLKMGQGCPVCSGNKTVAGINDMATTAPWILDWVVHKEDARTYSSKSNKEIMFKCIDCGHKKKMRIYDFFAYGFSCPRCSLKRGYPESFLSNLLSSLGVSFETRVTFEWSKRRQYDFYLPDHSVIIETHGGQHYKDSYGVFKRTLEEEQYNDRWKEEMARKNGIEHYIVLDCRLSELNHVKESIMNSSLPDLFDFAEGEVNWTECHYSSINTNITKEVCTLWNSGLSVKHIATEINVSTATIRKHLMSGNILNWCSYDTKNELQKAGRKSGVKGCKKVLYHNPQNNDTQTFNSIKECCVELEKRYGIKFNDSAISRVCNGKLPHYRKMNFNYVK